MNEEKNIIPAETTEILTEIFNAPLEQKSEYILDCDNPGEVMQHISPEETYLIYQTADDENLPDLLAAMNISQQTFIADFVLWENDIFNANSFSNWINSLLVSGIETTEKWLTETDLETLALGFGSMGAAIKRIDEETDMSDILPEKLATFTLDDVYYFTLKEEGNQEIVKTCLTLLYNSDKDSYTGLMEGLINESASEIMENAFEFRQDRLTYFGFPEKEDAFALYKPLTKEDFLQTEPKTFIDYHEFSQENQQIVHYPQPTFSREIFWDRVEKLILQEDADIVHQINLEIIWLVNKVIVTEGINNFTPQNTKSIMQKVKSILNIALEELSENDETKALNFCKKFWLEYIFRLGMNSLTPLRNNTKEVFTIFHNIKGTSTEETEQNNLEKFYDFLSPVFSKKTEGLLKTIPLYHNEQSGNMSFFTNALQVKESHAYIDSLLAFFTLLKDINAIAFMQDQKYLKSDFTIDTFIWTMFANFCQTDKISIEPVSFQHLNDFIEKALKDESSFDEYKNDYICELDIISKNDLSVIVEASLKSFKDEIKNLKLNKTEASSEETNLFIMKY